MNDTALSEFGKTKWSEGVQPLTSENSAVPSLGSLPVTAFKRFSQHGMFGLGESYQSGAWTTPNLTNFLYEVVMTPEPSPLRFPWKTAALHFARQILLNPQSGRDAFNIAKKHYDLGNELFETMLDSSMTYTCGLWDNAESLDQAQYNKLRRMAELLQLKQGMNILDIGCGWGNFAEFAAKEYGVTVTGVTVSEEQAHYAKKATAALPVEIVLSDYRTITGEFDAVVSIEMIEAVGRKNLDTFFQFVSERLKPGGRFALQAISADTFTKYSNRRLDQFILWILTYIFPDGYLPTAQELTWPERHGFVVENWENFGPDYEKTLNAWAENFQRSWKELSSSHPDKYGDTFYRTWEFYLAGCAALFRARVVQLYQVLYQKV